MRHILIMLVLAESGYNFHATSRTLRIICRVACADLYNKSGMLGDA